MRILSVIFLLLSLIDGKSQAQETQIIGKTMRLSQLGREKRDTTFFEHRKLNDSVEVDTLVWIIHRAAIDTFYEAVYKVKGQPKILMRYYPSGKKLLKTIYENGKAINDSELSILKIIIKNKHRADVPSVRTIFGLKIRHEY